MVTSTKEQLDKDEIKVLQELQKNSDENINTIAKHCGLSRQKAWRIIKQLEKNRFIWGYTAIVDEEKKELTHFIMLIKRTTKSLDKKITERFNTLQLEDQVEVPEVTIESSCFVHGSYDWIISFTAKDIKVAKKFCDQLIGGFPNVIAKIDLLQTLYFVRKHHIFNPDRKKLIDLM